MVDAARLHAHDIGPTMLRNQFEDQMDILESGASLGPRDQPFPRRTAEGFEKRRAGTPTVLCKLAKAPAKPDHAHQALFAPESARDVSCFAGAREVRIGRGLSRTSSSTPFER